MPNPSAIAPISPAPPRLPDVHFARSMTAHDKSTRRENLLGGGIMDQYSEWTFAFILVGAVALAGVASTLGPIPDPLLFAALGACIAAFLLASLRTRIRRNRRTASPDPEESDDRYRLRVVGQPERIDPAREIVAIAKTSGGTEISEPEVYRVVLAYEPPQTIVIRLAICLAITFVAIATTYAALKPARFFLQNFYVVGIASGCTIRLLWGFIWPTQIRIVPGRLDVLRMRPLGAGVSSVESYDLRSAALLVDLDHGRLRLQHGASDLGIWLSGVLGRPIAGGREMGLAALTAALSRFESPPPEGPPYQQRLRRVNQIGVHDPAWLVSLARTEPAVPLDATAPLHHPVHLAGMIAPQDRRTLRRSLFRAFNIDLIPEWAAAAACIVLIALGLARATGLIDPGLLLFLGVAIAVVAAILWIRHAITLTYSDSYPLESDPAYRLRVTGWGSILPAAAGVIERARSTGGREMSEPETFRISHAGESPPELLFRAASCFTVAILTLLLIKALFAPRIPFAAPWVPMLLALMITRTVWGFLWPTYVHIAPGHIEITRSPVLSLGPPSTTTYDLRTARILIDLRYGRVLLEPPAPDPQAADSTNDPIWLSGVMGHSTRAGQEMGLAILAAALSTFESPPTAASQTPHL